MFEKNRVHVEGVVKRDVEASSPRPGIKVMSFTLSVKDTANEGMYVYVDCFAATEAVEQLDGFVTKGETLAVDGSLTFRTITDYKGRKKSSLMVYVENVEEIEGE